MAKDTNKEKRWTAKWIFMRLFWILLTIYAVKKSYQCNKHESKLLLVPVVILAFFYSPYYLLYYGIYHFILRVPCVSAVGNMGVLL